MHVRSLIVTIALPLLPLGTWDVDRSVNGPCGWAGSGGGDMSVAQILAHDYGVREADLTRLCNGRIITGTLPTSDKYEMTLIGMIKLDATASHFGRYADEPERVLATGHLGVLGQIDLSDPGLSLRSYPILADDIREVPSCEIGRCDVKLPQEVIVELSRIDPSAIRFDHEVEVVIKRWLYRYLSSYRNEGDTALVVYADKNPPQSLRDGLVRLMADAQVLGYRAPRLHGYVSGMAGRLPDGARESVIWSVERFGMRPLTTVTHAIVYRDVSADHGDVWVAIKLLYASHYLHASFQLMRVVEDRSAAEPASYLVSVERLLFDGKVRGVVRAIAERRLRSHLAERLEAIRDSIRERGSLMADHSRGQ